MSAQPRQHAPQAERRVLVLAPTGRDAPLTRDVLSDAGIRVAICGDLAALVGELDLGAGAILLSEEALASEVPMRSLGERISRQPAWSDLPVLLLTHQGADSAAVRRAVRSLGNVTLIERPVRVASLVTATQTALRARVRQYQAREQVQELDHVARALRDSEGRLKALFANAAVGIAELEPGGRFALANDALCRILGERGESLARMRLAQLAHGEDREDVERIVAKVLAGEQDAFVGERHFLRRDGEVIRVKLSVASVHDSLHGATRGVAVVEDVTERKRAEEELLEADRRKDEFLATLAHELRNPLAPIRNSLHIFRLAGTATPAIARVVEVMERQVQHMVRLVDDLLEVSRVSRGKIDLRRERVELAAILRSAADTSLPFIEAGRHRFRIEVPPDPLILDADPVRLSQVFANLLNNAAKYTLPGGEISLVATASQGMATVCVEDNGEGIPRAMLGRVFNMFTQVSTGSRAQGGLGIGLTLARTLVQLHGGTIDAHSDGPGTGCLVTVRLPLAGAASRAECGAKSPGASAIPSSRRVLVVDDNHDAADSLGILLRFLGAEVHVAHDGPEALEAMRDFEPAVVLLDLGMPHMNGLEVARRVREDPGMKDVTLVALTGWGQSEDRRRTTEAGFDFHLVKPADITVLQSILAAAPAKAEPPALRL